jgi:hypothetical protein
MSAEPGRLDLDRRLPAAVAWIGAPSCKPLGAFGRGAHRHSVPRCSNDFGQGYERGSVGAASGIAAAGATASRHSSQQSERAASALAVAFRTDISPRELKRWSMAAALLSSDELGDLGALGVRRSETVHT